MNCTAKILETRRQRAQASRTEARPCGMLAVEGFDLCTVHLAAGGYHRCKACNVWTQRWVCGQCGGKLVEDVAIPGSKI